jgi:tetratricopeptide (TPR) repeat protein
MPEDPMVPVWLELTERLSRDPFFAGVRQSVTGRPADAPEVTAMLAVLRGWASAHLTVVPDGLVREEALQALLDRAVARPSGAPPSRRARFATRFPSPIATAYERATFDSADLMARYAAVLDAFESLQIFLVFSLIGPYIQLGLRDEGLECLVAPLILKGRLSSGDWSTLLTGAARALRHRSDLWIFPELVSLLAPPSGEPSRVASVLFELCQIRNDAWGHRIGRTPTYYASRLEADLALLEEQLDALACIEGARLVVPTRVEGLRVREGRVYLGNVPERIVDLDLDLLASPDSAFGLRPDASAVLHREDGRTAHLFPFYRYRSAHDLAQRGLYFLGRWQWARQKGRPRLRDVEYFSQDPSAPSARERHDVIATVERAFARFIASSNSSSVAALPAEDPDHCVHALWAERADVARRVVGQAPLLRDLADLVAPAHRGGTVVLTGAPGSGKTSLAYALYDRIADGHPVLHSISRERDPRALLRALIHQCAAYLGRPLGDAAYAGDDVATLRSSLERALVDVVRPGDARCVVVVDALDELAARDDRWDEAFAWLPSIRPPGLWVVLTCRPNAPLLRAVERLCGGVTRVDVPALQHDDLADFAERHFELSDLRELEPVIDLATTFARAAGHPLLLRAILGSAVRELRDARATGRPVRRVQPHDLSTDTSSSIAALWDQLVDSRHRASSDGGSRRRRLLEYLAIAGDPGPSAALLRAILEADEGTRIAFDEVLDLLDALSPWLRERSPGRYLLFHLSLAEYAQERLGDRDREARHALVATVLRDAGAAVDPGYWIAQTTRHATAGGLAPSFAMHLLDDHAWMVATLASGPGRPGRGASFGEWIAATAIADDLRDDAARRLHSRWAPVSELYPTLDPDAREQLAECLIATGHRELAEDALTVFSDLHRDTRDANFLTRRAWVAYQSLDRWGEARDDLEASVRALDAEGDTLGAARALRQLGAVLFDTGDDGAEAVLRERCLPALEIIGDPRETALARETLGIIVDAEARWSEALAHYARAAETHESMRDARALRRVALNRAVARLFTEGVETARETLALASDEAAVDQIAQYARVNEAMVSILLGDRAAFGRAAASLRPDEQWLQMTFRESAAVRRWFDGDAAGALAEMQELAEAFDALDDAWGRIDNEINAGFLLLPSQRERATTLLSGAHGASVALGYRVGEAMAAEGLRRLSADATVTPDASAFYAAHLMRLFRRCPSPFVPCYVLLLP